MENMSHRVKDIEPKDENPFKIPKSLEEMRKLDEVENERTALIHKKEKELKIWERGRNKSESREKFFSTKRPEIHRTLSLVDKDEQQLKKFSNEKILELQRFMKNDNSKERACDLVSSKREMFLLQMSINTKHEQVKKLEHSMNAKEEELKKHEATLEDDAIRFDAFLKNNDKKAQDMVRKGEKQGKVTNEIEQDVKRIKKQIQSVEAEINKYQVECDNYGRYKNFLDSLTPEEWFDEQRRLKLGRQRLRQQKRKKDQEEREEANKEKEYFVDKDENRGQKSDPVNKIDRGKSSINDQIITDSSDEVLSSSDEELPIYFKTPRQLREKCISLEEENLFLIQQKEESEQELSAIQEHIGNSKFQIETKSEEYNRAIIKLNSSIKAEEKRIQCMNTNSIHKSLELSNESENEFKLLTNKIATVYRRCNLEDSASNPTALVMLTEIEALLEQTLDEIKKIPRNRLHCAEKVKDKERRERKRTEKQNAIKKAQDERNRKSIERSLQPPKKSIGKPVMFRSRIVKNIQKKIENPEEILDEIRHFTL